ncbi:hypothetical protein G6O67_001870 [Ophiocordyceps sinensis]|uniref:Uncharacterized protein n=1 Tax=Ophiocordyceps sinensis TaxID=72228 RepID=A0A8H4PSY9_9HYPO|nr:hypothetical protein G6O67_001870 [Ophiocordyceps sinensis]
MARGEAEACWEQASPLARACFACAKSGSQCRPVVPAGEAAAKALGDYLVVNGSNPTADGGARDPHFTRLARAAIASRTR